MEDFEQQIPTYDYQDDISYEVIKPILEVEDAIKPNVEKVIDWELLAEFDGR